MQVRLTIGICATVLTLAAGSSQAAQGTKGHGHDKRPNIVLVMTDDQALSQMSAKYMPN